MSEIEHPLKKVSLRILEDWALMLVDPVTVTTNMFDSEQPLFMSWINLRGTVNGAISIIAQDPFINSLAANLIGNNDGEAPSTEETRDAFKEMGNVLAGNFVTEAFGEDAVFDLINPHVNEVPFADVEKFAQRRVVFGFLADDAPVAVSLSIQK